MYWVTLLYIYNSIPRQTKRTGYTFINFQWPAKLDEATSTKEVRSHFEFGFSEKQHNSQATSAVKFTTWSNISKSGTNWGYHDKSQREKKERERERTKKRFRERESERERETERTVATQTNSCLPWVSSNVTQILGCHAWVTTHQGSPGPDVIAGDLW